MGLLCVREPAVGRHAQRRAAVGSASRLRVPAATPFSLVDSSNGRVLQSTANLNVARELANGRISYDTPWSPDAISFWQGIPGINPVHGHRAAVSSGRAVLAAHGSLEDSGVCHLRFERGCVLLTRGCHRQRSIARPDVGWGMPYP